MFSPLKATFSLAQIAYMGLLLTTSIKFMNMQGNWHLTHCRLNELPLYILEDSNYNFRHVRLCDLDTLREKIVELFANSGDPAFYGI